PPRRGAAPGRSRSTGSPDTRRSPRRGSPRAASGPRRSAAACADATRGDRPPCPPESTAPGARRGPSGGGSSHPAPRTPDPMSSPQQRVHEATRRLLDLLEHGESLSPEAIELRCELAVATAEAGHLDDSYYQVEELL